MNCKPGDLAITHSMKFAENNNRLVEVLRVADPKDYVPITGGSVSWLVRSTGTPLTETLWSGRRGPKTMERIVCDTRLRPIRDPGQDAQDETLAWLPVPAPAREVVHG